MSSNLRTIAEESSYRQTGRIDEVERLSAALAQAWPQAVRSFEYGRSVEGRPLRALVASRNGALTPSEIAARGIPLLMIQAGIHPGESDGKDAGFIALRELLSGAIAEGTLDRISILFVPAFNTDGHERVGRWNRPNQVGPEEMGWRTNAQNLNLNRDYTKAQSPEMRAMLRLIDEWDPLVHADMHVTDGADFEPDISLQAEPINQGDEALRGSGVRLRDELIARLASQGSMPLPFYPDFARPDDPTSGFVLTVYSPRFSTGYFPQRNRFTVLVETHSWKPYEQRVRVSRNTIIGLVEIVAQHGAQLLQQVKAADAAAKALGGPSVVLDYVSSWREPGKPGQDSHEPDSAGARTIEFNGYAYTREPSAISGELVTKYDPRTRQTWRVPLRDKVVPSIVVVAPKGGYVVSSGFAAQIGDKLALHGIHFTRLDRAIESAPLQAFRATRVTFGSVPFEGCMAAALEGEWREEKRRIAAGAVFVPIAQPLARLVLALLEPRAPDSFAAWGFFNACFEQKEQLEPYVAEIMAREMLASDAKLKAQFEQRLKDDPSFAADPAARMEFFWRHHPSWDDQFYLYPVFRTEQAAFGA
jgi:hypothetical protein